MHACEYIWYTYVVCIYICVCVYLKEGEKFSNLWKVLPLLLKNFDLTWKSNTRIYEKQPIRKLSHCPVCRHGSLWCDMLNKEVSFCGDFKWYMDIHSLSLSLFFLLRCFLEEKHVNKINMLHLWMGQNERHSNELDLEKKMKDK